jgi:DNA-binding protein Fis
MVFEIQGQGFKATVETEHTVPLWEMLVEIERTILFQVLDEVKGVKARAAERLCLNRTTLIEKARKYGYSLRQL